VIAGVRSSRRDSGEGARGHGFPLVTHGYGPSPPVGAGEACTPSGCGNFMGMDPGCCAPWATAKASLQDAESVEGDNGVDPEWCAQGDR
jgi:hypothetical protein